MLVGKGVVLQRDELQRGGGLENARRSCARFTALRRVGEADDEIEAERGRQHQRSPHRQVDPGSVPTIKGSPAPFASRGYTYVLYSS